jgi:hypothetical protein
MAVGTRLNLIPSEAAGWLTETRIAADYSGSHDLRTTLEVFVFFTVAAMLTTTFESRRILTLSLNASGIPHSQPYPFSVISCQMTQCMFTEGLTSCLDRYYSYRKVPGHLRYRPLSFDAPCTSDRCNLGVLRPKPTQAARATRTGARSEWSFCSSIVTEGSLVELATTPVAS